MRRGPTEPTEQAETDAANVSRRRVLQGAAAGMLLPSGTHASVQTWRQSGAQIEPWAQTDDPTATETDSATVTVMTRNLYVGTNLFRTFADNSDDIPTAVGTLLSSVRDSHFEARAGVIADEIATTRPDLIGLQEVALLRIQRPGDYEAEPGRTNATDVEIDFLEILSDKLAERRLPYEVVSSVTNVDIELPAEVDAGRIDVRLTDRDVILARKTVTTENPRSETYTAHIDLPFPNDVTYPLLRGYCMVDTEVDGVGFTFVNTHLESISASTQVEQARELFVTLSKQEAPVVLVGDFNSPADGDGTVTYDLLSRFFTDAYAEVSSDSGYTCCQKADLRASEPRLGRRIDFVFYRGAGQTTSAQRVGADPDNRAATYVHGDYLRLWPSDHTGVVATLELDAAPLTASPTGTSTTGPTGTSDVVPGTADSTSSGTSGNVAETERAAETAGKSASGEAAEPTTTEVSAPGLGVVSGLAGVAAVAAALARRRRQS